MRFSTSMNCGCHVLFLVAFTTLLSCAGNSKEGAQDRTNADHDITLADTDVQPRPDTLQDNQETMAIPFDWCEENSPPDPACFSAKRDPNSKNILIAKTIAQRWMTRHPASSLSWNWEEAVLLWGIALLYDVTNEAKFLDYIRSYIDYHITKGISISTSDSCAPAAVAEWLYHHTRDPRYKAIVEQAITYLTQEALRSPEGGINHLGTLPLVTLWVDSLFMFGNVLVSYGENEGDEDALNLFRAQFLIFSQVLQDESGFFRHAAYWQGVPEEGVHWARGNGWALASAVQYLRVIRNQGKEDEEIWQAGQPLLNAIIKAQNKDTGLWWTVLDKPDQGYLETSASALFAYAMARAYRYNLAGNEILPVIWKAMGGVESRIDRFVTDDPIVQGTSGPTTAGALESYLNVKQEDDLPYGVGAVIMALVETSGLPDAQRVEVPLVESAQSAQRKHEYLDACASAQRTGNIYAQVCRVAKKMDVEEDAVSKAISKIEERQDTSDFTVAGLIRILYLDNKTQALSLATRERIESALLGFKYWLDEPGKDKMCYWSENHQILFHSAELLAGQLFKGRTFTNDGKTGEQHIEHARPLILRWLELRGRFGFSEWHSNVYFNEDIPALTNLADFAEDEELKTKAQMVLDLIAYDFLNNSYKGLFATVHGRTYDGHIIGGLNDSTTEAAWLMLGIGQYRDKGNFSGTFLATSEYFVPPLLEQIAQETQSRLEHRQKDGFDVASGPDIGISYSAPEDIVTWAGMNAIATPEIITGTIDFVDAFDLWDGFLFGDIPPEYLDMIKGLKGTPALVDLARQLEVLTYGIALESMCTYTYRTPDYQISGALDYHKGLWGAQNLFWLATLDHDAYVFTSVPGNLGDLNAGQEFATDWIGGWTPKISIYRNVGIIQYRTQDVPLVGNYLSKGYSHAYFPKLAFDEVRVEGQWVFGRKGDGYVALWSRLPVVFSSQNDYELVAQGVENTWVVELGRKTDDKSFDAFVAKVKDALVSVDDKVRYVSPSLGEIEVSWDAKMLVNGREVDPSPCQRWDNAMGTTEYGLAITRIEFGGKILELDFTKPSRRIWWFDDTL